MATRHRGGPQPTIGPRKIWRLFFFFNDTATTEIYTLSLHDALPISSFPATPPDSLTLSNCYPAPSASRSEEHTSELQSLRHLVCRLLLEKTHRLHRHPTAPHPPPAGDVQTLHMAPRARGSRRPGPAGLPGPAGSLTAKARYFFFYIPGPPRTPPLSPPPGLLP